METTKSHAKAVAHEFLESSRIFLTQDYLPKLLHCVEQMNDDDIWWRPNENSNSVGNLLMHLSGNLRQWILGAVGGQIVQRDRDGEFAARGPVPKQELMAVIKQAVEDVDRVLGSLAEEQLLKRHRIQKYDVTTLQAVYHVVEHFSYHLGQILYIYKLRTGEDPGFYRDLSNR